MNGLTERRGTLPEAWLQAMGRASATLPIERRGIVAALGGLGIRVEGLSIPVGALCRIGSGNEQELGEVVGVEGATAIVAPFGDLRGLCVGDPVFSDGLPLRVPVGDGLLGRILDPLGRPLDGGPEVRAPRRSLHRESPPPMTRRPIREMFQTGVSAIDAFTTLGRGQRIGMFAGSGVGKSTLLGSVVRGCEAERRVVCLLGERGREVSEFVHEVLGPEGLASSVVIVATADSPAPVRVAGGYAAVTMAESFREAGHDCLFVLDSITRFATAVREIGLAAGEPPTLRGYPPSLFARIPSLVERLGNDAHGTITALLTVLVEGDDHDEPVADAVRGHLDGHLVLTRELAERNHYPAIDVLRSVSRVAPKVVPTELRGICDRARKILSTWEEGRDLVRVGAWRKGADPDLDEAVEKAPRIEEVLRQAATEGRPAEQTWRALAASLDGDSPQTPGIV